MAGRSSGAGWGTGGSTPAWIKLRKQVIARDGLRCHHCHAALHTPRCRVGGCPTCLVVGHLIAKADGGPDTLTNVRAMCQACNLRGPMIRHTQPPSYPTPEW